MKRGLFNLNLLGLIASGLMAVAMFFPWWSFDVQFAGKTDLFPYLISGPGSELIGYTRSPTMTLLTIVLIFAILLCLVGSFLSKRISQIFLAISGALVILAAWRLLVRVSGVAARFHVPLQGHGLGSLSGFAKVEVSTFLQPGLYLAVIGGVLALIACVLYPKLSFRVE